MSILGERFYQMSNAIFCYDLKPVELAVYSYLVSTAGSKKRCWPSIGTISACCGCGKTTARVATKTLHERGFIQKVKTTRLWHRQTRQTNNTYYILDLPPLGKPKPKPEIVEDDSGRSGV